MGKSGFGAERMISSTSLPFMGRDRSPGLDPGDLGGEVWGSPGARVFSDSRTPMRSASSTLPIKEREDGSSLQAPPLEQPQRLEAGDALAADDEVVVDEDLQGLAGFDDLAGHVDVGR